MRWIPRGILTLRRRTDHSSASVSSALVNFPIANLASRQRQVSESDLPAWRGGVIDTPRDPAQRMISAMVSGPQFRAFTRQSKVTPCRKDAGGTQFSFGGLSPVISAANSFKTFSARTLSSQGSAFSPPATPFGTRGTAYLAAPKQVLIVNTDAASSRSAGASRGRRAAVLLRVVICAH